MSVSSIRRSGAGSVADSLAWGHPAGSTWINNLIDKAVRAISASYVLNALGFKACARSILVEASPTLTSLITYLSTGRYINGLASELDSLLPPDALLSISDDELQELLEAASLLRHPALDPHVKSVAVDRVKHLLRKVFGGRVEGRVLRRVIEEGGAEEVTQAVSTLLAVMLNKMEG